MADCEKLPKCGFFNVYYKNNPAIAQSIIKIYCNDFDKSEACERKIYSKKHGNPPEDNMSPTGKIL